MVNTSPSSRVVTRCAVCDGAALESLLFLGYLPPVNATTPLGAPAQETAAYPAELLRCPQCTLIQLGLVVDATVLFPASYPYTSSTTKILRENFAELAREVAVLHPLASNDLVVDIGSNDGNLLRNFKGTARVVGVTPEKIGELAVKDGIPTIFSYFNRSAVDRILAEHGRARLVTATNVFAHIDGVHDVVDGVLALLADDGVFVTESHYLASLVETVQYDTIYHEHLRYYSLTSLRHLLAMHGLEVFFAKRIPTHGGSIRVYAARTGTRAVQNEVDAIVAEENGALAPAALALFKERVVASKLDLMAMIRDLKKDGQRLVGIGAPSRASTLIHYVGLDDALLDAVLEVPGSHKIGQHVPGTRIPIVDEAVLFGAPSSGARPPDVAVLFSWHIADELMPKLRARGFKGRFLVPLPTPRLVGST